MSRQTAVAALWYALRLHFDVHDGRYAARATDAGWSSAVRGAAHPLESGAPATGPLDDELALVVAARGGDGRAFEELYSRHVRDIFGFLRARVGQSNAEDLTAETFTLAFKAIGRFEYRGVPFRAWLFRIANNLVIGEARRARDTTPLDLVGSDQLPTGQFGPSDEAVRSDQAAGLARALARLQRSQATVLDLRYLRESSVAETAAAMQLTEEAVRALTYRALRSLRSELGTLAGP